MWIHGEPGRNFLCEMGFNARLNAEIRRQEEGSPGLFFGKEAPGYICPHDEQVFSFLGLEL